MNLKKFLSDIDETMGMASREQLSAFIHERARLLDSEERASFLDDLRQACGTSESSYCPCDDEDFIEAKYNETLNQLTKIDMGDLCITAELNPDYDDWYDDYSEEFLYTDPCGIGAIIDNAYCVAVECIEMEQYGSAFKIISTIMYLQITVEGDEWDDCHEFSGVEDLERYKFVSLNYDRMFLDGIYAAYCSTAMNEKADVLYGFITGVDYREFSLEKLIQSGKELRDIDQFLPLWIEYLGSKKDNLSEELLNEALELSDSKEALLVNARKFSSAHPSLYEKYLSKYKYELDIDSLLRLGDEALNVINDNYVIRAKIARLLCRETACADKRSLAEHYMLEAFRSDTTVTGFMWLYNESGNFSVYSREIDSIIMKAHEASSNKTAYSSSYGELAENTPNQNILHMLDFLSGNLDDIKERTMKTSSYLGWSSTFMKCGIAAFLLLLLESDSLDKGCTEMCNIIVSSISFSADEYQKYAPGKACRNDRELFWECFRKWKKAHLLTSEKKHDYLNWLDMLIINRVAAIMDGNKRKYYGECAGFAAAYGEVLESMGTANGRQKTLLQYREIYPRRRAFHQELRTYGMNDIKKH